MRGDSPHGPLLFLSHAGVDTDAARRLKRRIEQAPEACKRGLKVWFDKDDLRVGESWQKQLEEAIRLCQEIK
jgi:TIR domain